MNTSYLQRVVKTPSSGTIQPTEETIGPSDSRQRVHWFASGADMSVYPDSRTALSLIRDAGLIHSQCCGGPNTLRVLLLEIRMATTPDSSVHHIPHSRPSPIVEEYAGTFGGLGRYPRF